MTKPLIICLLGPTASGKTQLAMELVQRLPLEIVSVDSAMIYRGMDIGTAKPSAAELMAAPHHLINICDPAQVYSAGDFCRDAILAIQNIISSGKTPLLVGGTMLYFRSLQQGIAYLPAANARIRGQLSAEALHHGWPALHKRLAQIDEIAAAKINPQDGQRIQRALEVFMLTGQPISQLQQQTRTALVDYQVVNIALLPENRELLHQRIAERFQKMLAQGFIDEVAQLYQRGDLTINMPALRTVGYRQIWQYLAGELQREKMSSAAIAATRQLAKHQLTWLRNWPNLQTFSIDRSDYTAAVLAKITDSYSR